jgi:hypothetical protein
MSIETTVVATSSLQAISLEHGQSYKITPNISHGNIRMGMVAIKNSFNGTDDTAFSHHVFSKNDPYPFDNSAGYDTLYIYTLLRWREWTVPSIVAKYQMAFVAGLSDGETPPQDEPSRGYPGARIGIDLVNDTESASSYGGDKVKLPADGLEFVQDYNLDINQESANQAMELHGVGKSSIEAAVQIQVLSGLSGNDLLGVMDSNSPNPSYFKLPPNSTKSNFILLAFVAPHSNSSSLPMDITFEVGDPEKDGSVGIRKID